MSTPQNPQSLSGANGIGIGLRHKHFKEILDEQPEIPWLEIHSENFFNPGSAASAYLEDITKHYPISAHGVGLSLGSADGLKESHLEKLKQLVERINPCLVSEHLSWSFSGKTHIPDLLPLPYTKEALQTVCSNVRHVQDFLGHQILVENPSSYLSFAQSEMKEWEFLNQMVAETGCGLLLDINNIYVSATNQGLDAEEYLENITSEPVQEIHLAGYSVQNIEGADYLIDTHGDRVFDPVWQLYAKAVKKLGNVPTLIEWDTDVPALSVLLEEAGKAQKIVDEETRKAA